MSENLGVASSKVFSANYINPSLLASFMAEFTYELKIPSARVAVLIGSRGSTKKEIERETKTSIQIDSKEGDIFIYGEDALGLYTTREIITAIGRGFNPEVALGLLKPDFSFEQINLADYAKGKNHFLRIKGRVIGTEGKARELIEELTDTKISVFGKTISIIGRIENVNVARKAVETLIKGSRHASVYKMLEKHRSEIKRRQFMGEA